MNLFVPERYLATNRNRMTVVDERLLENPLRLQFSILKHGGRREKTSWNNLISEILKIDSFCYEFLINGLIKKFKLNVIISEPSYLNMLHQTDG